MVRGGGGLARLLGMVTRAPTRERERAAALIALCAALAGCGGGGASEPEPLDPSVAYVTELRSLADVAALAASEAGAGSVKYLARIEGEPALGPLEDACYFQNMRRYPWHLQFLQSFAGLRGATLDSYRGWVLRPATRRLWGGAIQHWSEVMHPSRTRGVIAFDVYAEPGGLSVDDVAEADAQLKRCMPFARGLLVFVPSASDQEGLVRSEREALRERGVAALLPSDLVPDVEHIAYSEGEGYGYLKVVPRGAALGAHGPRDVVVVTSAPNDISVVAGLISMNPQNALGHVNLRLREKSIPNAAAPGIYDGAWLERLEGLAGALVRIEVSDDALRITPAELAEAEAFWEASRPDVRPPAADLEVFALQGFAELGAGDAPAYGSKAANLAELWHVLDAPHRPDGFAVPFARYRDFAAGEQVAAAIDALLEAPELRTDASFKRTQLDALRTLIRRAPLDAAFFAALQEAIEGTYGAEGRTTYLRFRSSTNVEDLDAFTGAGLYDSRSGCLADDLDGDELGPSACLHDDKRAALEAQLEAYEAELREHRDRAYLRPLIADIREDLTEEKPVADAVRKVYASLWNERAFDEREYYGIDHRAAYMGLAVNPAYALEQINAVAVSNLIVDDGAPLYRVSSQVGELSVVRPEIPTAVAEVLTFRREHTPPEATEITVQLASPLVPEGEEVWPRDKLLELSRLLFRAHDHFAREVYPDLTPLALDFEVKLERTGDVAIKQVRPYLSRDP